MIMGLQAMLIILSLALVLSKARVKASEEIPVAKPDEGLKMRVISPSLIIYALWTRDNNGDSDYSLIQSGNKRSIETTAFDGSRKTYVFFHAFAGDALSPWILDSKTALLSLEDCNVISVEYMDFALPPYYLTAVSNMYGVAAAAASFIDWLVENYGLSTSRIHITGHSLGAHAAGMTGLYVTSGEIARITGLDPAGPMFHNRGSDERLDKSHAKFVDVIHSNGCSLLKGCIGLAEEIGDVDFHPNGGEIQYKCSRISFFDEACSHLLVTSYWTESIKAGTDTNHPLSFVSWPCQDWDTFLNGDCQDCGQGCLQMGFHADTNLKGSYFLSTKSSSPFALGDVQQLL